jgi:hypothetical protein
VTVEILTKMVEKYGGDSYNLKIFRLVLCAFLDFQNILEMMNKAILKWIFHNAHVSVKVTNSKKDQKKTRFWSHNRKITNKALSSILAFKVFAAAWPSFHSEEFLFTKVRYLMKTSGYVIVDSNNPLSYT